MAIKIGMLDQIQEFFADSGIDDDWFMDNVKVDIDEKCSEITITISDMNDQELNWFKEHL